MATALGALLRSCSLADAEGFAAVAAAAAMPLLPRRRGASSGLLSLAAVLSAGRGCNVLGAVTVRGRLAGFWGASSSVRGTCSRVWSATEMKVLYSEVAHWSDTSRQTLS